MGLDAAAGGEERGRAEHERAFEHGASLSGMVDRPPKSAFHETLIRSLLNVWPRDMRRRAHPTLRV
jgi:hypothetical protein